MIRERSIRWRMMFLFCITAGLLLALSYTGFYFVFQAGEPLFRKYDAAGKLLFERHAEGRELDEFVRGLPTTWPRQWRW